jgi:hypothetical protein
MNFLISPLALQKTPQRKLIQKAQLGVDLDQLKQREVLVIKERLIGMALT